jgi:hypothetical protein
VVAGGFGFVVLASEAIQSRERDARKEGAAQERQRMDITSTLGGIAQVVRATVS